MSQLLFQSIEKRVVIQQNQMNPFFLKNKQLFLSSQHQAKIGNNIGFNEKPFYQKEITQAKRYEMDRKSPAMKEFQRQILPKLNRNHPKQEFPEKRLIYRSFQDQEPFRNFASNHTSQYSIPKQTLQKSLSYAPYRNQQNDYEKPFQSFGLQTKNIDQLKPAFHYQILNKPSKYHKKQHSTDQTHMVFDFNKRMQMLEQKYFKNQTKKHAIGHAKTQASENGPLYQKGDDIWNSRIKDKQMVQIKAYRNEQMKKALKNPEDEMDSEDETQKQGDISLNNYENQYAFGSSKLDDLKECIKRPAKGYMNAYRKALFKRKEWKSKLAKRRLALMEVMKGEGYFQD